ncbi:AAA family ATPase [Brachybacterium sp. P6-10-X1]|uniref:RNA polymerase recycling motor ATPase HelR n=1 Tax=Brachybacterium sp. P6-10-X1 TaxID=1903186 RepID=UPI00097174E5|nr:RNA polymerase recycling motor ATPase HelR [Brachybacterium sp. P6-10-X1]APX32108.1 AAA family ATPase [Brachybacterium sp. P6-10-X1]
MTQTSTFDLAARPQHKAAAERIGRDEEQFRSIATALADDIDDVRRALDAALAHQTGDAQGRVERDAKVAHFRTRLRGLESFRLDAVLGRMSPTDGSGPIYIGRLAVHGADGKPLLVDWRSPAAEPFFAATRADPLGLASRRRYRWAGGRVRDYWDEILTPNEVEDPDGSDAAESDTALDTESALLATLNRARSPRMESVLTTLAADQDAIIRASARRPLVVDGGPGTGKTVVALHRAAYLLYSDPRLRDRREGVLFIGPHHPYLQYVADVLPSLGEDDVRTCTLADLVPEGAGARLEDDPQVAALKATSMLVEAIEPAVGLYEEPPRRDHQLETDWGAVLLGEEDFAEAFEAVDPATAHNLAREEIWEELAEIVAAQLADTYDEHPDLRQVRAALAYDEELVTLVHRAWPILRATDLVGDLFEVPAYLRRCAPGLTAQQVELLQRTDARSWTEADLPLLDAARHRLGDPGADARRRRQQTARRETVDEVDLMVDYLIDSDSSDLQEMSMLRGEDLRNALEDATAVEIAPPDELAGPFAHVVVDEAQELTDAQWAMILRRCPSRSLTLVGDRAQAAHGFRDTWREHLHRIGLDRLELTELSINYRTPQEIMEQAAPVIRAELPDANVPTSVRESGVPVRHGRTEQLEQVLATWQAEHEKGTACVIGHPTFASTPRIRALTPRLAKGLEFDLVVLVDPADFGEGLPGAAARYVAMTRATSELVVLTGR